MPSFVQNRWINANTIEHRDYQDSIIKTALTGHTLVVLPTGLGKTPVAALVTAGRLDFDMDKKILFLAPTKPLVEQHRKTFDRFFKTGLEMKTVTGEDKPDERGEIYRNSDIIFSTPQTIRNDIKKNHLMLDNFSLLIVDEAHHAVGNYAYPYVAKVYMSQCKNPLILALTASPGASKIKIDEIKEKLFIRNIAIRTRDDTDVKPYLQHVREDFVTVEMTTPLKSIKQYLEGIKNARVKKLVDWKIINSSRLTKSVLIDIQKQLAAKKTGFSYAAMSLIAEVLKIDHALSLLETQCLFTLKNYFESMARQETKAVARLLKEEDYASAVRLTNELVNEGMEHPKIEKLKGIISHELEKNKCARIMVFAQYRDTIAKICEELKSIKNASPVEFIGQAKKSGKGLSQKEQARIINEFRMGFHNVLVASQVGEEGLDIAETDMVIFYEATPSAIRKIQRAGRTARTRPGRVIVLIAKDTRDEAYRWSGFQKEKNMKRIMYSMQKRQKTLGDFNG